MVILIASMVPPLSLRAEKKTMQRGDDPVVMECKGLAPLFGSPINELALMARSGDAWAPVPFQIDQKKPDGNYAFPHGPEASEDPDPNLDSNDELVFMVMDTGDRAGSGVLPDGSASAMEIEVIDPKNNNKAWVYLARFSGDAPRSEKDYVRLERDTAKKQVRFITDGFVMGTPMGRGFPDYFAIVQPDGSLGPDQLDQVKIPLEVVVNSLNIRLDYRVDKLIKSDNKGWIDGPVRILNLNAGYLQFTEHVKFRMGGDMIAVVYPNSTESPLKMEPPQSSGGASSAILSAIIPEVNEYVLLDFTSDVYGYTFFSKIHPPGDGLVFDGKMSDAEKEMDRDTPCDWTAIYDSDGSGMVSRVIITPMSNEDDFLPRVFYMDDKTKKDPPEDEPGVTAMGVSLYKVDQSVGRMEEESSTVVFNVIIYYKRVLDPERVNEILDIKDYPLEVHARPVESQ